MAINTTTRQTTAFTSGNNFAFAFKVYEEGDVKVIRITTSTGAEEVLTITTHYTITLNDDQNANPGGTVTLVNSGSPVNLGSGFNVVITSKITPLQQTEITNQGGFFPEVINDVLDKAAILDQQQQSILDKTIRFPLTQTVGGLEITENAANRAGKVVQFDGSGDLTILGTVDGRDVSADGAKLDTIETNAKDDQTAAEIRALTESATDSNVFTDADHSKLNGIEAGATADLTASEIKALYEGNSNTNVLSDAQVSKLNGIEAGATGDQTASEIRTLVGSASDSNVFTDNDHSKLDGIETGATADQTSGDIKTLLQSDKLTASELANNSVTVSQIQDSQITAAKLDPATVITASEQASATPNDTSFLTSAAADARFFNVSTGDTIKDGDTFPDNDTTIATTAAINDRIIDLVDDVGGFVPIANETSFPTANPDAEDGTGTVVSVKAASTNLTPSGTTVTIANGAGTGNTVTITGVPSVIPSGFGFLVETTATSGNGSANPPRQYTFHRLTPKATEVTTVAGKAVEIGRLGTADAVADMAILGTTDVVADMNMLATTDIVADMALLANTDVIADMALLAVSDVISDMNDLATSANITAMSTCSTNIASINNASANISSANNFGDQYQVASNNPSTDGGGNALAAGDLYFNTSANELKIYNGSAWQAGVTATGNFASTTGNTFTGDNRYNDNVKALFGTGSDLEIFHNTTANTPSNYIYPNSNYIDSKGSGNLFIRVAGSVGTYIGNTVGEHAASFHATNAVKLYYDNVKKFETASDGILASGAIRTNAATSGAASANQATFDFNGQNARLLSYHGSGGSISAFTNPSGGSLAERFRIQADGNIVIPADNQVLYLGVGNDLKLYHDGNHSYVSNSGGAGNLLLYGNGSNSVVIQPVAGENSIVANSNSSVELFYDNSKKFETHSTGGNVTGSLGINTNTPASTIDARADSGATITARNTGTAASLAMSVGSTTNQLVSRGVNSSTARDLIFMQGTTTAAKIDTSNNFLILNDNAKLQIGADQDLEIYHASNNSYIDQTGTGHLFIRGNGTNGVLIRPKAGENSIAAHADGDVELYYDNSKKFETQSTGAKVTGTLHTSSNVRISGELDLGTNNGNKFMDVCLGDNYGFYMRSTSGEGANHEMLMLIERNKGAKLYYDAATKFETSSDGITVTGAALFADNNRIKLGGSAASPDTQFWHDGSNTYIHHEGTGDLIARIAKDDGIFRVYGNGNTSVANFKDNAEVELFYNGAQKFETTNTGVSVSGNMVATGNVQVNDNNYVYYGTGGDLKIRHTGSAGSIRNDTGSLTISTGGSGNANSVLIQPNEGENSITAQHNGAVELYFDGSKKLETASDKVKITGGLDMGGHVWPYPSNTYDLGTTDYRWRNVYTNDLNLSNEGSSNDVDGTWGSYTIQEGAEDLFLINKRNGKKYKFALTEVS